MMSIEFKYDGIGDIDTDGRGAEEILLSKSGKGCEFTGWVDLPVDYDKEEFGRILRAAEKIRKESDILIVCGIGGSYLGAEAAMDFLKGKLANLKAASGKSNTKDDKDLLVFFTGNNLAPGRLKVIMELVGDRDFSVNVISKSGGTMETAVAFRIFRKMLEERYGVEEASKRIYATTSKDTGLLKAEAERMGYETFIIPDDVGGRYSVLTAVGLLPLAAAGCDIRALMAGAADMRAELMSARGSNIAVRDAQIRQQLYKEGKKIEIFASYDPEMAGINEWLKQLFGESEGKDKKGIFPVGVSLSNDLHSMGQMIQEGERIIFETVIDIKEQDTLIKVPAFDTDFDKLGYLEGKPVSFINACAKEGTYAAHLAGGVPQIRFTFEKKNEYSLGELFYFFEYACAVSAYMMDVNPFNQPGVEAYKKNMKGLLGDR